jgi:hypothetical protein|tara:strand:+ start:145 stop:474 length:330 start_codon:yes stop_codon:yes gene_type:complete
VNKITSFIFLLFIVFSAQLVAEEITILEEIPSPPNTLDSGYLGEPEITIRQDGTDTLEEHRINGKLYLVKITPENFPAYYLVRELEGGDWLRMDDNKPLVVPQWVVASF